MRNRKAGFTLIELMIVVAVIGIIAAVAIPKLAELVARSKLKEKGFDIVKVEAWCKAKDVMLPTFADDEKLQKEFKYGGPFTLPTAAPVEARSSVNDAMKVDSTSSTSEKKFCPYCGHSLP